MGRELIDASEAGLGEAVEVLGPCAELVAELGDATPHRLAGDAVEAHQLVQAASRSRLRAPEREVQVRGGARPGRLEPAVDRVGQPETQVAFERLLRVVAHAPAAADLRDRGLDDRGNPGQQRVAQLGRRRLRWPTDGKRRRIVRPRQVSPSSTLPRRARAYKS